MGETKGSANGLSVTSVGVDIANGPGENNCCLGVVVVVWG